MFRSVDELADHEGITTLHRCGHDLVYRGARKALERNAF